MTKKEKNIIIKKAIMLYGEFKDCEANFGKDDLYTQSLLDQWSGIYDIIELLGITEDYIREQSILGGH